MPNIPKIIHFIYLNEIPIEYIFGGEKLVGLYGVCKKAEKDGYLVNLWVPNPKAFNRQLLKARPALDALLDTNIRFPNLQVRNLNELNPEIESHFTKANGFDASFVNDLKKFIKMEEMNHFNLAAASNIWRLILLALKGGIYCDISKTFSKTINPDHFKFDPLIAKARFGFAQRNQGNYLLVGEKMHTVAVETLKYIVEKYRLIYRASFTNLIKINKGERPLPINVIKAQEDLLTFIDTTDPVSYARSQTNPGYREASTELLHGVYALHYGFFKHFYNYYKQYRGTYGYKINHKNSLHCYSDLAVNDYVRGKKTYTSLMEIISAPEYKNKIPLREDYSLKDWNCPLATDTENRSKIKNWRNLVKVSHDDTSISSLFANTQPTLDNDSAAKEREAILKAINNYLDWSEKGNPHRGPNGWLTWFRHGQYGRDRAKELAKKMQDCKFTQEIQEIIEEFLAHKDTRFNNHSLASFVLDELLALKVVWLDTDLYPEYKPFDAGSVATTCKIF